VALGAVVGRVRDSEGSFTGASDHHVSEALYLRDPEGNGVEVYADRPQSEWETEPNGGVRIDTLPLHLDDLLAEAASDGRLPTETTVGHVRLKMTALNEAVEFYRAVGFGVQARMFGAAFLVAGDYYHPGLNVWATGQRPTGQERPACRGTSRSCQPTNSTGSSTGCASAEPTWSDAPRGKPGSGMPTGFRLTPAPGPIDRTEACRQSQPTYYAGP